MDFGTYGQTFIESAPGGNPGGSNAQGINPGNGFSLGTQIATTNNAAILITGNPVPEPSSMAALAIGALALIRRRRSSR